MKRMCSWVALALACSVGSVAAEPLGTTQTTWLFNSSLEGWTYAGLDGQVLDTGNGWWVIDPGSDPRVVSPLLTRSPSSINYIKMRVKNKGSNSSGRIYFSKDGGGMSETNSKAFTTPADAVWHWIVVRLDDIPGWGGSNIDQIRIDPVSSGCSPESCQDDILIDAILLRLDTTAPEVTGLAVDPSGWTNDNDFTFTWNEATDGPDDGSSTGYGSGVDHYEVSRDSEAWIWNGTSTTKVWTAYQQGNNTFKVKAIDVAGNGSATSSITYKYDSTLPANPTSVSSSDHSCDTWAADQTVSVSWSGASDAHSGVSGYSWVFDNSSSTTPDGTQDGTGTSTVSGTLGSGDWYFHVRTRDNAGNWASGGKHSCRYRIDATVPVNPTTVSSSDHSCDTWSSDPAISVSWSGASDAHSGVSGYSWVFDNSSSSTPDGTQDGTGTSTTSGSLASGDWYFHVRTRDNVGNWASGGKHSCRYRIDVTAPSNPTTVSSSHTVGVWSADNTVDVSWSGASDAHSGVSGYSWMFDNASSSTPDGTQDGTVTSTTSGALASGDWYFHVRTRDNVANWASGGKHAGPYRIDATAPANPTSVVSTSHVVSVASCDETVAMSWSGASDAHSGVSGYSWVFDQSPTTVPDAVQDGTGTSTTSGVLVSGDWYFHIRTRDAVGNWAAGAEHVGPFVIAATGPGAVTSLGSGTHTVGAWSNATTVQLMWEEPGEVCGGIGGYSYVWSQEIGEDPDVTIETSEEAATIDPAAEGAWYFHVRAVDVAGYGGPTEHLGPFYIDTTPPENPTTLTSSSHTPGICSSDNTVDVEWSGATDGASGVSAYSWEWDILPATLPDAVAEGAETEATSLPLPDGSSYYVHVRTVDEAGNWSAGAVHLGPFCIDQSEPGVVLNLASLSHAIGEWSNDPTIEMMWDEAPDKRTSIGGYSVEWTQAGDTEPDVTVDVAAPPDTSDVLGDGTWYYHVRAIDQAGNAGPTTHLGPFRIDTMVPVAIVVSPNGGEHWQVGSQQTILFAYGDAASGVVSLELRYSVDGTTYPFVIGTPPIGTSACSWTVPDTPTALARVKLVANDGAGNSGEDASNGSFSIDGLVGVVADGPVTAYALYQNVPNPFNPSTVIRYDVPKEGGYTRLRVLDMTGRTVTTLVDGTESGGRKAVAWDGTDSGGQAVGTGIYFSELVGGSQRITRKMVLLK